MRSLLKLSVVAVFGAALTACGGGAKLSKDGAAAMLLGAAQTGNKANQGGRLLSGATESEATATVDCSLGGSATASAEANADFGSIEDDGAGALSIVLKVEFKDCAEPYDNPDTAAEETDKVVMNGVLRYAIDVAVDGANGDDATAEVNLKITSDLKASGAVDDFLKADVVFTLNSNALSEDADEVEFVVDGSIETSSEKHAYNKETIKVGGAAAADDDGSSDDEDDIGGDAESEG